LVVTRQSVDQEGQTAWLDARPSERYRPMCSACGEPMGRIEGWDKRAFRDLPLASHQVWIGCKYRKAYCPSCRRIRVEDLGLFARHQRVTRRLARYLHELCRDGLTVQQVADRYGLRWDTVKGIDKNFLEEEYGQMDLDGLRILSVDEISIRKRHHYLTIVLDYETGRVVWTGTDRSERTLSGFFASMTDEQRSNIRAIAMDMHDPYIKAAREAVPQAKIVFDLYHVVAAFNRAIDQVRISEFHKASKEDKHVYKGTKYLLLSKRKNIRRKNDREHLRKLMAINQVIFTMMILKELLPGVWQYRSRAWARRALLDWCDLAESIEHTEVRKFVRMLKRYEYGIVNHCEHPIHNSRLEGVNNKIKVIKRVAYGFHDHHYFSLKIFQAFDPKNRAPT
jgi:transposase